MKVVPSWFWISASITLILLGVTGYLRASFLLLNQFVRATKTRDANESA